MGSRACCQVDCASAWRRILVRRLIFAAIAVTRPAYLVQEWPVVTLPPLLPSSYIYCVCGLWLRRQTQFRML